MFYARAYSIPESNVELTKPSPGDVTQEALLSRTDDAMS